MIKETINRQIFREKNKSFLLLSGEENYINAGKE
jgi:hypothetical protein